MFIAFIKWIFVSVYNLKETYFFYTLRKIIQLFFICLSLYERAINCTFPAAVARQLTAPTVLAKHRFPYAKHRFVFP